MHLLHSTTACGEMEQSELQTLQIRSALLHVSVFRVCVCLLNNDQKKELRCEDLGTKVDALQDLSNGMAMRAMEKLKTDIS